MVIGPLLPGARPEAVVPAAAAAVGEITTVEAADLTIVSGAPRVTVRFTGDDDAHARRVASAGVDRTRELARVVSWIVTRRDGGRWSPVLPT